MIHVIDSILPAVVRLRTWRSARWSPLAGLLLATTLGACMAPPPTSQRVMDAAREMNTAARFGRLDVAASLAAEGARKAFLERRATWGRDVRVLDVELTGMSMQDEHNAVVEVDVAWVASDDTTLRATRVAQVWSDHDGGWQLVRERRASGDLGLFGEPRPPAPTTGHRDVHFPTRTIR